MSGGCVRNPIGFECAKPARSRKALFLGVIQDFLMNGHHSVRCLSAVPCVSWARQREGKPMPRHLPPSNALRAFEAAARSENFTRAAEELGVSQAAVSQQVKGPEATLDVRLFTRGGRRLLITGAGREYLSVVRDALDRIAVGTDRLLEAHVERLDREYLSGLLGRNGLCTGSVNSARHTTD
jgi:predicted transcriptional regulator